MDLSCSLVKVSSLLGLSDTSAELLAFADSSLSNLTAAKEGEASSWQHIDQSPSRVGFFVAQGLVNLNDNDAEDGGLLVMKGSSRLMSKFFDIHGRPSVPAERVSRVWLSCTGLKTSLETWQLTEPARTD